MVTVSICCYNNQRTTYSSKQRNLSLTLLLSISWHLLMVMIQPIKDLRNSRVTRTSQKHLQLFSGFDHFCCKCIENFSLIA